jgi:hypothetical protein
MHWLDFLATRWPAPIWLLILLGLTLLGLAGGYIKLYRETIAIRIFGSVVGTAWLNVSLCLVAVSAPFLESAKLQATITDLDGKDHVVQVGLSVTERQQIIMAALAVAMLVAAVFVTKLFATYLSRPVSPAPPASAGQPPGNSTT